MKRFVFVLLSFLAFFYTIRSVTCPTCVGLPQKGSRPFFEHGSITYIQNDNSQSSKPADEDKDSKSTEQQVESPEDEE